MIGLMGRAALVLVVMAAFASSALAQNASDKVKIEVTRAELQIIGQGVMELPYKVAAPVMQTLQQQLLLANDSAAKAAADARASADKAPAAEQPAK